MMMARAREMPKRNGTPRAMFDRTAMLARNPRGSAERLAKACVGIAGAGGLGTNAALALARAGVGRLVIADFDVVELSNLNRQQYSADQIGMPKVEALKDNLLRANPSVKVECVQAKLDAGSIASVFRDADVLVEAFDRAEMKKMLIEEFLLAYPNRWVVAASGVAGYGRNQLIRTERAGRLFIVGDQQTEASDSNGLISARVAAVANLQANQVVEILMGGVH